VTVKILISGDSTK